MGACFHTFIIVSIVNIFLVELEARVLHIGCLVQKKKFEENYLEKVASLAKADHIDIVKQHGYEIKFTFRDSGCNSTQGLGMAGTLLLRDNVTALIGPSCNDACVSVANLASFSNIPMISYACTNNVFNGAQLYIRTIPNLMHDLQQLANVYSEFIYKNCEWRKLSVVYSDKEPWISFTNHLQREFLKNKDATIKQYQIELYTDEKLMLILKKDARSKWLFT